MKALIIFLTGPFMAAFVLAAGQTIEWCTENGVHVPAIAWVLLAFVAIWCVAAYRCSLESLHEAARRWERFLDKLLK
ncbi:MAG: hypothetical protein LBG15_08200 [Dysgonamonadaceae bacterium]|jgi:hypothetical protein|nr:hypothetical protein [Dysgonamonadaceae bacterium]